MSEARPLGRATPPRRESPVKNRRWASITFLECRELNALAYARASDTFGVAQGPRIPGSALLVQRSTTAFLGILMRLG